MRVHLCGKGFRGWGTGEWRYIQGAGEGATDERSCKIEEGNCCAVVHTNLKPPPHPTKCEKIKRYQIIITSFFRTLLSLLPIPPTPQAFFLSFLYVPIPLSLLFLLTHFSSYTYNTWGKKKKEKKTPSDLQSKFILS